MDYFLLGLILLLTVVLAFLLYCAWRGTRSVSYTCEISLAKPHVLSFLTAGSAFRDRLRVRVDGSTVVSATVTMFNLRGTRGFVVDGEPLTLRWRWSAFWGDTVYILLESQGRLLAHYGKKRAIRRAVRKFGISSNQQGPQP